MGNIIKRVVGGSRSLNAREDTWREWVTSLGNAVQDIAMSHPIITEAPSDFFGAHRSLPLDKIFDGRLLRETVGVSCIRLGQVLEIIALGAEPSIEWQTKLNAAVANTGCASLCGYCGDVFGYLPTPEH